MVQESLKTPLHLYKDGPYYTAYLFMLYYLLQTMYVLRNFLHSLLSTRNVGSRFSLFGNLLFKKMFKFLRIFCLNIIFNGFYVSQCYSTDIFTKINVSDFNQKKVLTTPFIQTILTHKLQVPFLLYVIGVGYIQRDDIISEGLL